MAKVDMRTCDVCDVLMQPYDGAFTPVIDAELHASGSTDEAIEEVDLCNHCLRAVVARMLAGGFSGMAFVYRWLPSAEGREAVGRWFAECVRRVKLDKE